MKEELLEEFASGLVRKAISQGASAAEVLARQHSAFSVGVRMGEIETLEESASEGFGLRVLIEGRQASVSGSDFHSDAVDAMVREAVEMARATSPDDTAGLPEPLEFARSIEDLDLFDPAIAELSTETQIEFALRAEQAARDASTKIVNSDGGEFTTSTGTLVLANSLGFHGRYNGTSCSLSTIPVATDGDRMQRDSWADHKRKLAAMDAPEEIGRTAAARTLRKLGGRAVPTQTVPVVFEPVIAAELLDDIFTAVSGESVFRKSSFLAGRLGERVASSAITVIDDGRIRGALGSRPFDGEGLSTRRTAVIQEGILESYLLNAYTARKLGLRSTGNASRGLVGSPGVGAGNLYIEPGSHSPADIVGSVSKGFLVTELIGFGVNIVTGDYSRSASGMWIENGELAFPVQGVTIAGNLKGMLSSVEMVGNDLDFRSNLAAPTLLIGEMMVSA
ncbi:MAG TPA: TldD/PmbA family protein [Blastocatellia bacterium]|nr:TldD/PmbA family protein [Blastocatellia bacterium]